MRGERTELPTALVILPAEIHVYTVAGHAPPVRDEAKSEEASARVGEALRACIETGSVGHVVPTVELSADEMRTIHEHARLLETVATAGETLSQGMSLAWGVGHDCRVRYDEFDCTLGTGLAFLKARTGASAAIIATGVCEVPEPGNETHWNVTFFGPMPSTVGGARLRISIVDLESGDVLWSNAAMPDMKMFGWGPSDVRDGKIAKTLVDHAMSKYPGLDSFRELWTY